MSTEADVELGRDRDLPRTAAHPFYAPQNQFLDQRDSTGTSRASASRSTRTRRPALPPGRCFGSYMATRLPETRSLRSISGNDWPLLVSPEVPRRPRDSRPLCFAFIIVHRA